MLNLAIINKSARESTDVAGGFAIIVAIIIIALLSAIFILLPVLYIIGGVKIACGQDGMNYIWEGVFGVILCYVISITYLVVSYVEHIRPIEPRCNSYDPEKNREEYEVYEKNLKKFEKKRILLVLLTGVLAAVLILSAVIAHSFAGALAAGIIYTILGVLALLSIIISVIVMVTGVLD